VGGKRVRLRIDNAAEDVPRLMTAYGRLGKGQRRPHGHPASGFLPTEPPTVNAVNLAPRGPLGRPTDRNVTVQGGGLPRSRARSSGKPFPQTSAGGWRAGRGGVMQAARDGVLATRRLVVLRSDPSGGALD